ncbi:MAG TPA: YiiD C-terminal domain-containing protein [Longimicrobiaceae bacterium]|nr:YiiD C-terminal domain-containing protein [Longimicrobiaceae bacterium]
MSTASRDDFERDLELYLHKHIPISAAMGVTVASASADRVHLQAPLDLNINHRSTVFGGSAAAVAILAGWSLLHVRIGHEGRGDRIVIQRSSVDYVLPIDDDFDAIARAPDPADWRRFQKMLARRGVGRIDLAVELRCHREVAGECVGAYVVLPTSAPRNVAAR